MKESTDAARRAAGFLGIDETAELGGRGITVLDPCSTLISPGVLLEAGVVLWPGTAFCRDAVPEQERFRPDTQ